MTMMLIVMMGIALRKVLEVSKILARVDPHS
jgi:hypothetical protein